MLPQRPHAPATHRSGFTLIELLVVIAIMAILAATTLPMIPGLNDEARVRTCETRLAQIGIALRLYVEDQGSYPTTLQALYDGRYLEQQGLLRCDRAEAAYWYSRPIRNAAPGTLIVSCTDPSTPAGKRPHRHNSAAVALHMHGGTTLQRVQSAPVTRSREGAK